MVGMTYKLDCHVMKLKPITVSQSILCLYYALPLDLYTAINPLNAELNPICYLLALLGAHHFLHVSRIRVKCLPLGY